jgi:hypothetical protein
MSKASENKSDRAEKREARRAASGSGGTYKTRSAASRRAEARARAAYRGADEGMSGTLGDSGVAVRDVGVRVDLNAPPRKAKPKTSDQLDQEQIAHLLHNPTKTVPESVLREQYTYVLADVRSMALLAAALFALLVVLALTLP